MTAKRRPVTSLSAEIARIAEAESQRRQQNARRTIATGLSIPPPPRPGQVTMVSTAVEFDESKTQGVLRDVLDERAYQHGKWGKQEHPNGTSEVKYTGMMQMAQAMCNKRADDGSITWFDILQEEFYEAASCEIKEDLRAELIQVAAVAVAWIEMLDEQIDYELRVAKAKEGALSPDDIAKAVAKLGMRLQAKVEAEVRAKIKEVTAAKIKEVTAG